jgi:tRNA G18 (ribose-2'-O)-methylase SpoU
MTYTEVDWRAPCALIVGAESIGLSSEEIAATGKAVRIPMRGSLESLNVAVASGILLYEAARQQGGN